MKISIIYFSETGTTETVAGWIGEGIEAVPHTEVQLFNLKDSEEPDLYFIQESDAIIFGTPTYVANMAWQMKKWFDTHFEYRLAGKLGAAFATENSPFGGGAEEAIVTLHSHMLVRSMMVYSSGCSFGQPFIHLGPTIVHSEMQERAELCRTFGTRIAEQAHRLFDQKGA